MIIYITHLFFLFLFVYMRVLAYRHVQHIYPGINGGLKRGSEALKLELHVVAGIWVPC